VEAFLFWGKARDFVPDISLPNVTFW